MKSFNALSIKTKVIVIVFFGVSMSMLIALVYFISYDRIAIKRALNEELAVLASITAARSGAAVAFMDVRAARENLSHLSIRENIQKACIYQFSGVLFAEYERNGFKCDQVFNIPELNSETVFVVEDIKNMSQDLGHILLVSDLSPVENKVSTWLWLSGFFLLLTMSGVLLTIKRLQHYVIDPLLDLTKTMGRVQKNNDLSLRVASNSQDEIGRLIQAFNDMLSLIETGNKDLSSMYKKLVVRSTEAEATAVELDVGNQKIKEHLTSAAHDLRQPLQAMSIFSDMLLSSLKDSKRDEYLVQKSNDTELAVKIRESISNLQFLFKDILDAQKFDYTQAIAEQKKVHLNALIEKLSFEFKVLAEDKNIDLRFHLHDIFLNTVPGFLERLIRNLVSNAIRYTNSGGVLISARIRQNAILLDVWDTGCGIDHDDIMRIFNRFERVEKAESIQGSYGLGLAIVGNFVTLLGYRLVVHSKVGVGSRFRVEIPISKLSEPKDRAPEGQQIMSDKLESDVWNGLHKEENEACFNVLLVDDDVLVLQALAQAISAWGGRVLAFSDMAAVERYFCKADYIFPDIIVSDYHLDNNNTGDKLIETVRKLVGKDIPACIITATDNIEILNSISELGVDCYHKPLDMDEFREHLKRMLSF